MSQSSDFEAVNFVTASLFTPGPSTPAPSTPEPPTPAEARATRRDEDRLFRHFRGYTWSQRSRNTKSWVWEYGFDIEKDSERRWVCRLCIKRNRPKPGNVIAIGTQNAERHLWDHHKIQDPSRKRSAPASRKKASTGHQTITKAFNLDLNAAREQAIANHLIKSFDRNVFQRLVVKWIIESNLSFREPENKRLRAIFEYLNPFVASADAHVGHDTVRKRAVAEFEKHKGKDGKARKLILGVPELTVRHFGANIRHEIVEILEPYKIPEEKIGYFTLNNAPNDDTTIDTIRERFKFYGKERWGRCFGHVINLMVKAILFRKDADAFESRLEHGDILATAEHELWRKRGPVGKLHNLMVAIHRSNVLTTLLRSLQRLEFDVSEDPRLYMIRRALKLRPYLETLVLKHKQEWEKDNTSKRSKRSKRLKTSAIMPAICRDENKLDDKDWAVLEAFGNC
ncbi:hypothetical protein MRS44_017576 [Fusarium solani]|uniref:uncharacterized protein n=1 Tax=Fusarium solani TaxID=169388 RepID=UPI0032C46A26|nr:hypothetical protein MRS44_017576 [Fusarium solani]